MAISAIAFATSSAAPPPRPITASARCVLYMETPAFTWLLHRVAPDLGVDRRVEAGQHRAEFREQRQRRDAAIGDDQRTQDPLRLQVVGDEPARAGAEVDGRGEG